MKRLVLLFSVVVMLISCSKDIENITDVPEKENVTITFSPYSITAMTRAAVSIGDIVNHLDVWIIQGTDTVEVHQTTSDDSFGTITITLDKTKTYSLYAIGHRADGATLSDGVISFTDDKVTQSMFYSTTFSPGTTTSLSCQMNRIVAQFRLEITDDIPEECKKLQFTLKDVYDRWNVSTGGTHQLNRTSVINYGGTSATFNVYAIVTDDQTTHNITISALDANDQPLQTRTFTDVPLRNGYKTSYKGTFFTDTPTTAGFTVEENWNEYDVVNF